MGSRLIFTPETRATAATASDLSRLGAEVAASLEDARVASAGSARVRARLALGEPTRARAPRRLRRLRRGAIAVAAGLATAAAVVLALFSAWPSRAGRDGARALTFRVDGSRGPSSEGGAVGAFLAASADAEMPLAFSDGTRLRLAPRARARVAEITPNGARVLLEGGVVHADVAHLPGARWAVDAGPFEVHVTGTRFDVAWEPASASIDVVLHEGSVVVTGCALGEGRRIVGGEHLRVSCTEFVAAKGADAADAAEVEEAVTPQALPDAPPEPAAGGSAGAGARVGAGTGPSGERDDVGALARRGEHARALAAAEARGFASTCDALSAAELLALADAARYGARFDRAEEALRATRRRFPGSDAAATAAFELGRIAFDVRRDYASAGGAFDDYLGERPAGGLAREALGRALEARVKSGDAERAEPLAVRYLAAYPDGPHAALARRIARGGPP